MHIDFDVRGQRDGDVTTCMCKAYVESPRAVGESHPKKIRQTKEGVGSDQHASRVEEAVFRQTADHAKMLGHSGLTAKRRRRSREGSKRQRLPLSKCVDESANTIVVRAYIDLSHGPVDISIGVIPVGVTFDLFGCE